MNKLHKKISVVIPTYNEQDNLRELYNRLSVTLEKLVTDHELIFIDNKSTDGTRDVIRELAEKDKRVIAIFFSRNFGNSQYGFTAGTEYATGDAVVWIDADLQDPPEIIEKFVEKWREGYDVVYGIRVKRKEGFFLRAAFKIFYILLNKISFVRMPMNAGDFSLIDRKVIDVINSMPERDRYIRGLRAWVGFKSTGVNYHRDARHMGATSNNLFKHIKFAKKAIFSFSYMPIEIIFYSALAAFIVSVFAILFYFASFFFGSGVPKGFTSLLLVVLFLGSVQLLSISVIAEYVSRIFEEVKNRPKYVIEEVINKKEK